MSKSKSVLTATQTKNNLVVVGFRLPSHEQMNLNSEMKEAFKRAYYRSWKELNRLGIKIHTSTLLSRKSKEDIEKAFNKVKSYYENEGLVPPQLNKTSVEQEEEESWLQTMRQVVREQLYELRKAVEEVEKIENADERQRKMRWLVRQIREYENKWKEIDEKSEDEINELVSLL